MLFSAVHTIKVTWRSTPTHPGKEGELKTFKHLMYCSSENMPQKFFRQSGFGFDWKCLLIADLVKKFQRSLDLHTPIYPVHHFCQISLVLQSCFSVVIWILQSHFFTKMARLKRVLKCQYFWRVVYITFWSLLLSIKDVKMSCTCKVEH